MCPHRRSTNRSTRRRRRHFASWRCGRSAQASGRDETEAADCCPQHRLASDIVGERSTGLRSRYFRHHDRQLLDHDMARHIAGSVFKTLCPQLRRMHRKGRCKWCDIHRRLVVVQQSGFQELTGLGQKHTMVAAVDGRTKGDATAEPPLCFAFEHAVTIRFGSQCEELNVSKSSPLRLGERTSVKRAATSQMGQ
jgi:hypothetical protein